VAGLEDRVTVVQCLRCARARFRKGTISYSRLSVVDEIVG
jgi:hypothetical protein